MRKLLLLSLIGLGSTWFAHSQYTQIPDPYFEHALIDLGIDSDGEINGQVLTSDIENIEVLRLYNVIFNNLIGLEDFTSLKTLDLVFCRTNSHLDLSIAPTLEVFKIYGKTDNIDTNLTDVDLTNNPNLRKIEFRDDWVIRRINLKGSDQYIDSLYIGYIQEEIFHSEGLKTTEMKCYFV